MPRPTLPRARRVRQRSPVGGVTIVSETAPPTKSVKVLGVQVPAAQAAFTRSRSDWLIAFGFLLYALVYALLWFARDDDTPSEPSRS